jgi:hypothetical protein
MAKLAEAGSGFDSERNSECPDLISSAAAHVLVEDGGEFLTARGKVHAC